MTKTVFHRIERHLRWLRIIAYRALPAAYNVQALQPGNPAAVVRSHIIEIGRVLEALTNRKLSVVSAYLRKRERLFIKLTGIWESISQKCRQYLNAVRHCAEYREMRRLITEVRPELRTA